ncbi:fibrobacter succinogenes major paralogous domain-containing protein [Ekhidna sp. MALMAid0563]|uniref:fibrobacter succinogenes major paralogous domain-containing protein n=1 Tax=Ekhidna sp. MALMAid0563 TaxID=3143937 RepID=UPI0032DF99AB
MKKPIAYFILTLLIAGQALAQNSVTIGNQTWSMNLNVVNFRNGDAIPRAKTDAEWKKAADNKQPAWCYYNNDPTNSDKYGILYNWFAVNDPRGLAPEGWHIATKAEWEQLANQFPNQSAEQLKTAEGWSRGFKGNNATGFTGYPLGIRGVPKFFWGGQMTIFWTSDENDAESAHSATFDYNYKHVVLANQFKVMGLSVRCVKD